MELYLGIDIGTTHIKVCAADTNGRVVKTALRDQESRPVPGWGNCISPEELWDKTAACLEEVLSETEPGAVKGIGITSMAEAGVPVGRDGKPLMPIIPWNAWDSTEITGEEFPESLRGWGALPENRAFMASQIYDKSVPFSEEKQSSAVGTNGLLFVRFRLLALLLYRRASYGRIPGLQDNAV